jgi:cell division control protein 6
MSIFKTRQPFREEYIPDTVVALDDTISHLGRIFQDFVDGSRPPHLLIHGDSGTGKRTVIRHILNLVEREVEREIEVITIDCKEYTSLHKIYVELAYLICEEDYRGRSQLELEQAIVRQMDDSDITWYLVFENLEGVGKDDLPFDELQQAISTYGTTQTECGVIGTANQSRLYDHLPGEVVHRSYMHTLETTPYDATQLRHILESRADVAFSDNGLSERVIPKCAAIIAQETGSATEALQLLELAGYLAHQADADQVAETHVDTATESREALDLYTTFTQELNPKEQLLCAIIAVHTILEMTAPADDEESQAEEDEDDDKITTSELYQMYENTARSFDLNNVEKRRIEQLIGNLRDRGLVKAEKHNEGRASGTWLSYKLTVPPHQILRSATARSGRFKRFLRKHHVSLDGLSFPDDEVDIDAFLSDNWP